MANGVRWVKTLGKIQFGESVVISGPGSQGLCSLAAALHAGAAPVIVLGRDCETERLKLAREFGAHHIVNVDQENPVEAVTRILPEGPDAVIETSGSSEGIRAAIEMVRRTGRIVTIGLSGGVETPINFDTLVWKSISLLSGLGQAGNVADAMKLIDTGKFPFEKDQLTAPTALKIYHRPLRTPRSDRPVLSRRRLFFKLHFIGSTVGDEDFYLLHIYVDADACPIKPEVYRVAKRYRLDVTLVTNAWMLGTE